MFFRIKKPTFGMGALVAIMLFVCSPASAQKVWEKKPYQQWSLREALKILTDSPWAQTEDDLKENSSYGDLRTQMEARNDPYPTDMAISIRLRSALIIRQAFVRQKQITIKYDKMKPAEKAKFDDEVKGFIECPECATYFVVSLDSRMHNMLRKLDPKKYSLPSLQLRAFLSNDKQDWRPCLSIREENQELLFYFKRLDDKGKSLITSENAWFAFTMAGKINDGKLLVGDYSVFEVPKITINGVIMF